MRQLIFLEHFVLFQRLHGVDLAGIGFLNEAHFTKRAFTDDFDGSEIGQTDTCAAEAEVAVERVITVEMESSKGKRWR